MNVHKDFGNGKLLNANLNLVVQALAHKQLVESSILFN